MLRLQKIESLWETARHCHAGVAGRPVLGGFGGSRTDVVLLSLTPPSTTTRILQGRPRATHRDRGEYGGGAAISPKMDSGTCH
jgi:hypothetical protein